MALGVACAARRHRARDSRLHLCHQDLCHCMLRYDPSLSSHHAPRASTLRRQLNQWTCRLTTQHGLSTILPLLERVSRSSSAGSRRKSTRAQNHQPNYLLLAGRVASTTQQTSSRSYKLPSSSTHHGTSQPSRSPRHLPFCGIRFARVLMVCLVVISSPGGRYLHSA